MRAPVKITPGEKNLPAACRLFSRGVILFLTPARVSLALPSLRKNGGLLVVYLSAVVAPGKRAHRDGEKRKASFFTLSLLNYVPSRSRDCSRYSAA